MAYVIERARLQAAEDHAADRGRSFTAASAETEKTARRTATAVDALVAEQRQARELEQAEKRDLAERRQIAREHGLDIEDVL